MAAEGDVISSLLSKFSKSDEKLEELFSEDVAHLDPSTRSEQKAEEISPEDAAWVDSCLVGDPEPSDDSWSALREALLNTLYAPATDFETPTSADADEMQQENNECVQVSEEVESPPLIHGQEQPLSDDQEEGDVGSDTAASGEDMESPANIFRVWDLETPDEEDELIKQLKKALAESRLGSMLPSQVDLAAALDEQKLNELVTGVADLSLKPFSD